MTPRIKTAIGTCVGLVLLSACASTPTAEKSAEIKANPKELHLALTGGFQSELEPCGCQFNPLGGVGRSWRALGRWRNAGEIVHAFSAGASFTPDAFELSHVEQYRRKAEATVDSLNFLGFDAVSPSAADLRLGLETLQKLKSRAQFAFVSSDLYNKKSHIPIFERYREEAGANEVSLFVVGLSGANGVSAQDSDIEVLEPAAALRPILGDLDRRPRVIVLLSSLGRSANERLAKEFPQINVILGAGDTERTAGAEQIGRKTLYVSPYDRGASWTRVTLDAKPGFTGFYNEGAFFTVEDTLAELESQKYHVETALSQSSHSRHTASISVLKKRKQEIAQEIASLSVRDVPPGPTVANFASTVELMDTTLDSSQSPTNAIVDKYKAETRELSLNEIQPAAN